jgi:hypothetical protein
MASIRIRLMLRQVRSSFAFAHPGRSGYPNFSGRVVRVIRNSGIEKRYPISAPKYHSPKFRVPDNSGSGSGIPELFDIQKKQHTSRARSRLVGFRWGRTWIWGVGSWWSRGRCRSPARSQLEPGVGCVAGLCACVSSCVVDGLWKDRVNQTNFGYLESLSKVAIG